MNENITSGNYVSRYQDGNPCESIPKATRVRQQRMQISATVPVSIIASLIPPAQLKGFHDFALNVDFMEIKTPTNCHSDCKSAGNRAGGKSWELLV